LEKYLKIILKNNIAMKRYWLFVLVILIFSSCVNTPRNYKPAGFNSKEEVQPYLPIYLYLANCLTQTEWDSFYKRFPEYWKDIQKGKQIGYRTDYHPWYVAYAFRWNTLKRKQGWDIGTQSRLDQGVIKEGDSVYQLIYSLGPPSRIIWDNDFEILLFPKNKAVILNAHEVIEVENCDKCWLGATGEEEIIKKLDLVRPKY
jgi:hypothetical protein